MSPTLLPPWRTPVKLTCGPCHSLRLCPSAVHPVDFTQRNWTPSFIDLEPHISEAKELLCGANESKVKKAREPCPRDFPHLSRKCPHFGNNLNSAGASEWTERNNHLKQRASLRIAYSRRGPPIAPFSYWVMTLVYTEIILSKGERKEKGNSRFPCIYTLKGSHKKQPAWI